MPLPSHLSTSNTDVPITQFDSRPAEPHGSSLNLPYPNEKESENAKREVSRNNKDVNAGEVEPQDPDIEDGEVSDGEASGQSGDTFMETPDVRNRSFGGLKETDLMLADSQARIGNDDRETPESGEGNFEHGRTWNRGIF